MLFPGEARPSTVCPYSQEPGGTRAPMPWAGLEDKRSRPPSFSPDHSCIPLLSCLLPFLSSSFALPSICSSSLHLLGSPTPIHQSEIREPPLPSGETSSAPAAPPMRPEVLEQTEAARAFHPRPEDTPLYPDPYQTPSFHFSIRDTQLPGVGLPTSCSPWRVKRAVSPLWLAGGGCH